MARNMETRNVMCYCGGMPKWMLVLASLCCATPVLAVVTSSTRTVSYSPSTDTSVFTVTFPFDDKDWLVVTKITDATSAETVLTRGVDYTVALPLGSTSGFVTTTVAVTSAYSIRIDRIVPYTQTRSFKTQQSYSPVFIEDSLDKLTMIAQQLQSNDGQSGTEAVETHVGLNDPHSQYAILAGRSAGQTLYGGDGGGLNLTLHPNSDENSGYVYVGNILTVDSTNDRVGIGDATPDAELDVVGSVLVSSSVDAPTLRGGAGSGDDLTLSSTSHATKGFVYFEGDAASGMVGMAYQPSKDRLGIGTLTPLYSLDVPGGDAQIGTDLLIDANGDILKTVTDDCLSLSGGTTAPGSGAAGFVSCGGTHATLPDVTYVYGDSIAFANENGQGMATMTYGTGSYDSTLTMYAELYARGKYATTSAATYAATAITHCGGTVATSGGNTVVTLPNADSTNVGCRVTLLNTAASNTHTPYLQPHSSDGIKGSCTGPTTTVNFSGAANAYIKDTKLTSIEGDHVTVVSDGSSDWWVVGCMGDWAN